MSTALPPTISDGSVTLTQVGVIPGISAGQYFGYCTIAGVKYEFPNIAEQPQLIDATYGTSRIAQEIFGAAIEIQAELDQYYVMPYTGSSANILAQLWDMNAKLAVARIIKRFFNGEDTQASVAAEEREQWVADMYHSIKDGSIRWDAGATPAFGDAVARAMLPVYDTASGITVFPNATTPPIFTLSTATSFDRSRMM